MADDRVLRIENRNKAIEQWVWKTISTAGMALIVWYLSGINGSLKELSDDIIQIKLADSASAQMMAHTDSRVSILEANEKEFSKRVGELERKTDRHDQRLNNLERR